MGKKLSELTEATTFSSTDIFHLRTSGAIDKKISGSNLLLQVNTSLPFIKLYSQTIDNDVAIKDCIYYDTVESKWMKAGKWKVPPQGMYIGSNTVLLVGYISGLTGLTAGKVYWMTVNGTLIEDINFAYKATRVAYAISTTELIFQVWLEQDFDSVMISYGFFGGGFLGSVLNIIEYINTTLLTGNAIDRGDLSASRAYLSAVSGSQYGFFGGGYTTAITNIIDYINTTLLIGNAVDRGDLSASRQGLSGVGFAGISGPQYGFFGGGNTGSRSDIIDYIDMTIITVVNAVDRGNLTITRDGLAGVSGPQYGFFGGGTTGTVSNVIDYIDLSLITGDATDRGDLSVARRLLIGVSGPQYGFFGGGNTGSIVNTIDYIDLTILTGNALDRGDLTVARYALAGLSGPQYGFFGGGISSTDTIDYIDMTIIAAVNALDRGNLSGNRDSLAGVN